MRKLILSFLFLCVVVNSASCTEKDSSVYLKAKSVLVSSFDTSPDWAPPPKPEAVIDGSIFTRWSSNYTDNQWISLDFGQPKVLHKLVLFWEAAYAIDYDILTSLDGENWQPLSSLKNQDGGMDELEFAPVTTRFVKLIGQKKFNPQWGISLWEFLCFGPANENPQDKPLSFIYPQLVERVAKKEPGRIELEMEKPYAGAENVSLNEFHKGIVYTSWGRTELGEEPSDQTLKYLSELGITHLGIMVVWFQDSNKENLIFPDAKDTPDDKALVHAINMAHSLGMKVMLKPHVDVKTGQWRGDIIPSEDWFCSYKNYIIQYARLAEKYNVEFFSIGTELVNTTLPKWQARWEEIINEVREIFPGYLVYSANWDEYKNVGFWEKLDFVGIDAYFPLTAKKDPQKEELISAWQGHAQEIAGWLKEKQLNKPVLFTEVGYCSADGTNIQPWAVLSNLSEDSIDQEEQANCLQAMLVACSPHPWFGGFYWWNYFPQERWSPLGYTIIRKEAEEVLSKWLKELK